MKHQLSKFISRAFCLLLLLSSPLIASAEPFETIINNGSAQNRVDIAIVGDGYTAAQMAQYRNDVLAFMQGVFNQEPYREYQRYYNVHRIDVISNQSGADHPERMPPVFIDTAFDATYNCQGIQRLICVNTGDVMTAVDNSLPASHFDVVLIMVNDPEYGGSGGSVAVASIHPSAVELILHEVGHSFGLLADEYAGGGPSCNPNIEPSEPNATRQTVRALIKWNHWIDPSTPVPTITGTLGIPGLYQGSKYCDVGLYRPTFDNKMRTLGAPFEQINNEQHVKRFYNFVSPIDASSPTGSSVTITQAQSQTFNVTTPQPFTHNLNISWTVDGQPAGTGPMFTLNGSLLTPGPHVVQALISDPTPFVRNDPSQLLSETRIWNVTVQAAQARGKRYDFDGDGKTDVAVFRPSNGTWYMLRSANNSFTAQQFGGATDRIVPGDYDGDLKTDIAVFRPSTGTWYILNSSNGVFRSFDFGISEDVPMPGYFDGDSITDIAVWRPSTGTWYIINSSTNALRTAQFGLNGDRPVAGDYDGDASYDLAVFRPSNGTWYILQSTNGLLRTEPFGISADKQTPDDYDGDAKTDIAVFRPSNGTWYILQSTNGAVQSQPFGISTDAPAPGDYDGDAKADTCVFRNGDDNWYILQSLSGFRSVSFGTSGDIPVPSAFVR